eukprot:9189464-Ditylum_brightwellii.AAC.1
MDEWELVLNSSNQLILKESLWLVLTEKEYISSSVTVSSWLRCNEVDHHNVTMSEINMIFKSYKTTGFGSCTTVKYVGFVMFQGVNNEGNRVVSSPVTGSGTSSNTQYYCFYFSPIYQPLAEKLTNVLAIAAETITIALDTNIHPVLPNHKVPSRYSQNILGTCHKKIITCGVPNKWFGYASCIHVDNVDIYKQEIQDQTINNVNKINSSNYSCNKDLREYSEKFAKYGKYGRKTTCVYQFVGKQKYPDHE